MEISRDKVAIPTALIAVILSTLGAYAVARLDFRGKNVMLNSILIVYLFPGILLIIPLFAMVSRIAAGIGFDIQDNLSVLVFTYLAQTLPVALYMINTIFNDPSPRPHVVMAASTIMTLPIVILFLALERFLEEGLTAGDVKG